MNVLTAPAFLICCAAFVVHQILQKVLHIPVRFADDYLDNLLVTPILLTLLLVERRVLFRKGASYTLRPMEVIMATILIALVCELLFPYLSDAFITDWIDIVFYIAGSLIFYNLINFWRARAEP